MLKYHLLQGPIEDPTISDAVNMRLAAAVETISQTSAQLRETSFGDDWRHMKSLRNRISHGYSLLDRELVKGTVEEDVPFLSFNCVRHCRALQPRL